MSEWIIVFPQGMNNWQFSTKSILSCLVVISNYSSITWSVALNENCQIVSPVVFVGAQMNDQVYINVPESFQTDKLDN